MSEAYQTPAAKITVRRLQIVVLLLFVVANTFPAHCLFQPSGQRPGVEFVWGYPFAYQKLKFHSDIAPSLTYLPKTSSLGLNLLLCMAMLVLTEVILTKTRLGRWSLERLRSIGSPSFVASSMLVAFLNGLAYCHSPFHILQGDAHFLFGLPLPVVVYQGGVYRYWGLLWLLGTMNLFLNLVAVLTLSFGLHHFVALVSRKSLSVKKANAAYPPEGAH